MLQELPRITIVTPSFNQGQYIEATIQSVLSQNYTNLEYIIIDGGSTDDSVEIIRKYEKYLRYWVSEKDRGQSNAINKGFQRATGEIVGWLNSDDLYAAHALHTVADAFLHNRAFSWVVGGVSNFSSETPLADQPWQFVNSHDLVAWVTREANPHQPGVFWKRQLFLDYGYLDEAWHYCFDAEFWCRLIAGGVFPYQLDRELARFRLHAASKTCGSLARFHAENIRLAKAYRSEIPSHHRILLNRHIRYSRFAGSKLEARALAESGRTLAAVGALIRVMAEDPALLFRGSMYSAILPAFRKESKTR